MNRPIDASLNAHFNSLTEIAIKNPKKLRNFLRKYEHDHEKLSDIISESLLCALRSIKSYRNEASIETWFYAICKHVAMQHIAKEKKASSFSFAVDFTDLEAIEINSEAVSPEDSLYHKQLLRNVDTVLSTFSSDLDQTFRLVCVDEYSYELTAAELKIPLGTVRSRINRARRILNAPHF